MFLGHLTRNDMHLLPQLTPAVSNRATARLLAELPLANEISWSHRTRRPQKPTVHSRPNTVHSRPGTVHPRPLSVHPEFIYCAVSPLRLSAPSPGRRPHRRESAAHPRASPRALRGSNSPSRRLGTDLDRRRNTGRGPRISTFRDEPSLGFLPRRLHGISKVGLDRSISRLVGR